MSQHGGDLESRGIFADETRERERESRSLGFFTKKNAVAPLKCSRSLRFTRFSCARVCYFGSHKLRKAWTVKPTYYPFNLVNLVVDIDLVFVWIAGQLTFGRVDFQFIV